MRMLSLADLLKRPKPLDLNAYERYGQLGDGTQVAASSTEVYIGGRTHKVLSVQRLRDGGTADFFTHAGTLHFPSPLRFKPGTPGSLPSWQPK